MNALVQQPRPVQFIDPHDCEALKAFGEHFWLNSIHDIDAGRNIFSRTRSIIEAMVITEVDRLEVTTSSFRGDGASIATILDMPCGGTVDGMTALKAVWAGYMASLKATMDSGRNPEAHIGKRPDVTSRIAETLAELNARVTPRDDVFSSYGNYLELLEVRYDEDSRTLFLHPFIGT